MPLSKLRLKDLMLTDPSVVRNKRIIKNKLWLLGFLQVLSSEFSVAKVQMLTGSDVPTLAEAYNRLSRLAVSLPQSQPVTQSSALVVSSGYGRGNLQNIRGRGRGRGMGGRGKLQCTFCGKSGHLEDRCWDKHGRPTSSSSKSYAPKANVTTLEATKVQENISASDSSITLSRAEYDELIALRPLSSTPPVAGVAYSTGNHLHPTDSKWIIDSGASRHLCGNSLVFSDLKDINAHRGVSLADGSSSPVVGQGNISISLLITVAKCSSCSKLSSKFTLC